MKHERDRTKLKFYKGEYIGFEVARKAYEEHKGNLQKEFVEKDRRFNEVVDDRKKIEEQLKLAENQVTVLKKENEQYEERAKISTLAKRDL